MFRLSLPLASAPRVNERSAMSPTKNADSARYSTLHASLTQGFFRGTRVST